METDAFERLLLEEISESITEQPNLWKKSIFGIQREDGLELFINGNDVSIRKPKEYIFKSKDFQKALYKVANVLYKRFQIEWETDVYNTLVESLTRPEKWKKSIWGIEQKGDYFDSKRFDLKIDSYNNNRISIVKPFDHKFSNNSYEKHLREIVVELVKEIEIEEKRVKEQESRDTLSEFFSFNDRKHKLKILQIIADEEEKKKNQTIVTPIVKPEPKKKNFFEKLFNL